MLPVLGRLSALWFKDGTTTEIPVSKPITLLLCPPSPSPSPGAPQAEAGARAKATAASQQDTSTDRATATTHKLR